MAARSGPLLRRHLKQATRHGERPPLRRGSFLCLPCRFERADDLGYTKQQLAACVGASIPDLIGADCRLLFVGINPGLQTALTGIHFAHPSNRFWPALRRAGIIDWVPEVSPPAPSVRLPTGLGSDPGRNLLDLEIDTSSGMSDEQRRDFTGAGLGITNLVARATTRAAELGTDELRDGAVTLAATVSDISPRLVAVAGVSAFRTAFARPAAAMGLQEEKLGQSDVWVVPNPSGLNAHETIDTLAVWFRKLYEAAN